MKPPAIGGVGGADGCPTVCAGIVSPAGIPVVVIISSAPDDHFAAGPDCRVKPARSGRVDGAGGCPTIRHRIVSPAGVQKRPPLFPPQMIISLPVQTAVCQYRPSGALMVLVAIQVSVLGLYLPPVLRGGKAKISAPDNHFSAGPDRRVIVSGSGRVGGAGGGPTVSAGIVSAACVQTEPGPLRHPPQTIISLPVHTAV